MIYPEYAEVNGKQYKINTDFRVAIECNRVAEDSSIGDLERSLAVIYLLYGNDGINNPKDYEKLLELARKYLLCGEEYDAKSNSKPDMDFVQDANFIASSFQYDYKYNPYEMEYCHWWKFCNDLNNLSNSEFGNCCVLNRVRNLRNYDAKKIKNAKERQEFIKLQKRFALKDKKKTPTEKQKRSINELYEILNRKGG